MKRASIIVIILTMNLTYEISGQVNPDDNSLKLEKLFAKLAGNYPDNDKLLINDSVRTILESYAASDKAFKHHFNNLRFLGQITSSDSILKIITWNYILKDGLNKYFCYFIKREVSEKPNRIYSLSGSHTEPYIRTDTTYSKSDWYGALYYDIRPFTIGNEVNYILLGIDYGNSYVTRKMIEVLRFGPENEIIFGRNCFVDNKITLQRAVFEYASTAVMTLKFITDKSIVFSHLAPFTPEMKNNPQFYGPDYSYDSYNFENGSWRLNMDIDIRNKE
jgi:hypothetical protein